MTVKQLRLQSLIDTYVSHKEGCKHCIKQVKGQTVTLQFMCTEGIKMFREISKAMGK